MQSTSEISSNVILICPDLFWKVPSQHKGITTMNCFKVAQRSIPMDLDYVSMISEFVKICIN
jgi:hypothetical protein